MPCWSRWEWLAQARDQLLDLGDRLLVGFFRWTVDQRIRDHLDLLEHMIEDHDRVGEHEHRVWNVEIIDGLIRQTLEEAHHVIAEIADCTAEEARQTLDLDGVKFPHQLFEGIQGVHPLLNFRMPVTRDLHAPAFALKDDRRLTPQEAVASPFFPSLDTFQEE